VTSGQGGQGGKERTAAMIVQICTTRATARIKTEWIFRMTEPPKRYPVSRKYTLVVEKYKKIKKVFIIGIP